MAEADVQYNQIIKRILNEGKWDGVPRAKWDDGEPAFAKTILNQRMMFDNSEGIPILTSKKVAINSAIAEILWIWQKKSNVVQDLRDMGSPVWNKFELEDGTIGKAYGWQLGNKNRPVEDEELDQVDFLIHELKTNPYSRRIKTTLWCVEDLPFMSLEPCVYETHWQYWDDKLHLTVNIRSNDMGLGNPFNIFQYSVLHRLIAQVVNIPVGTICFNIDNSHVYDRHVIQLSEQIERKTYQAPELWINPEIDNFYDFTLDDIKLINYQHGEPIRLELSV
ncbi:MAG: thymidylate synthase [Bacillaceae bacterium]